MKNTFTLNYKKLDTWYDPKNVYVSVFKNQENSFWLERKTENDFFTYIGTCDETISYNVTNNKTKVIIEKNETIKDQDIFSFLDEQLKTNVSKNTDDLPFPFVGGYIGYFGYELKALTGGKAKYISEYPDSLWFFVKQFLVFDHKAQFLYLVSLQTNDETAEDWFTEIEKRLINNKTSENESSNTEQKITFETNFSQADYLQTIQKAKEYLRKGESYEICLTNTFTTETNIDPFDLFTAVRKNNPSPYLTFLKHNDLAIVSSTPEQFLTIAKNREILSKPIKGTIARGENETEDEKQKNILLTSEKDLAENLMITDLLRNDLGKICEIGSVNVPNLQAIESYQTVHQMVSTVTGKLRPDVSVIESIKTCFPGGSMTGAPKIRTMEILDNLEPKARGIYSGAFGYIGLDQTVSLNIVIRTIIMQKNKLAVGAGGAILYLSDPQKEYEEMLLKARVLMETITQTAGVKNFEIQEQKIHKVFIALGSNVGDKKKHITDAITILQEKLSDIKVAKFYVNPARYYEQQADFVNTVLVGQTTLNPEKLLLFLQEVEVIIGRQKRFKNGPREIDLDILFYDDEIIKKETLQVPHPLLQERDFVLIPITEIAPDFVHPVLQKTMNTLRDAL